MKFTDLDKKMRCYETAHDHCALPGIYLVARIDGRNFSTLTKETCDFEAPFDERFRDMMAATMRHLCSCGFQIIFGFSQSDEINLLLHPNDQTFGRKLRKYNSILAAEASAKFSILIGRPVAFDCRISQLPRLDDVCNYFLWRQEDAHRNALGGHCYWYYRRQGLDHRQAHQELMGMSNPQKHELLFQQAGINFNHLPSWQKRGFGIYWQLANTNKGSATKMHRELIADSDLPIKTAFATLIRELLATSES